MLEFSISKKVMRKICKGQPQLVDVVHGDVMITHAPTILESSRRYTFEYKVGERRIVFVIEKSVDSDRFKWFYWEYHGEDKFTVDGYRVLTEMIQWLEIIHSPSYVFRMGSGDPVFHGGKQSDKQKSQINTMKPTPFNSQHKARMLKNLEPILNKYITYDKS